MSEEEKKQTTNKESLKNSLCYIPFVSIVLFFTEQNKSVELMKHIKYGTMLLVIYLILNTVLGFLIPYAFLFIIYVVVIGIIMYRVYNGEQVDIEYLDKFELKVKEKWNDIEKKDNIVDGEIEIIEKKEL